ACFSELNGILPSSAGIRLYFGRAFGEKFALIVSIFYMLVIMGVVGAESYILANVLSNAMPWVTPFVWIIVMQSLATVINIRGIRIAGNFQDLITYCLIAVILVLSFLGLKEVDFQLTAPFSTGGMGNLFNAVAVGVFLFVGFEWVTPLAEEVSDSRIISKGMFYAVGVLSVVYSLFTVVMTANVPRELLANSPVPQLLFAKEIFGAAGVPLAVLISLGASITTFNAGLLSVSRFFYATAREKALPAVFSKVSIRYFTPWVSILAVFSVGLMISMLVLFSGKYLILVNMAAGTESVIYALAGVAVLILRKKMRDREESYKVPFGPIIPVLTSVVFTALALGVFYTDPLATLFVAVLAALIWWYVANIVPAIKEKAKNSRPVRRRPKPLE
ncbi:MAG: APC family permease, partial [Peptococcaceae bacterium]|nr:APC family permease [Peptococcaceae bacterium]